MVTAIVLYIGIGAAIGGIARVTKQEISTLAGMIGTGGAAGLIGGIIANLAFSDGIEFDMAGAVGCVVLAIVAVLAVRVGARERIADGVPPPSDS